MKFEIPTMSITMFAKENVVTQASTIVKSDTVNAARQALNDLENAPAETNTVVFTF